MRPLVFHWFGKLNSELESARLKCGTSSITLKVQVAGIQVSAKSVAANPEAERTFENLIVKKDHQVSGVKLKHFLIDSRLLK